MTEEIPKAWRLDHFEQWQYPARGISKPIFPKSATSITGSGKNVRSISWSCDGKKVATGTELKGIRVWSVKSTIESSSSFPLPDSSSRPSPHNGHVADVKGALAFSPIDPNLLVSGCKSAAAGGCIAIWDLTRPREAVKKFQIAGDVLHIAFHPSGRQFAVVCPRSRRDEVYFYHLTEEDGKEVWSQRDDIMLGGPGSEVGYDEINSLRFHQNGQFVMYVSNDGTINAWEYPEIPLPNSPEQTEMAPLEEEPQEGEASRPRTPRERTPDQPEEGDGVDVDMDKKEEVSKTEDAVEQTNVDDSEVVQGDAEAEAGTNDTDEKAITEEDAQTKAAPNDDADVAMDEQPSVTAENSIAPTRQPSPVPIVESKPEPAAAEPVKKKAKQLIRFKTQYCGNSVLLALNLDPLGRFIATGGGDCRLVTYNTADWVQHRAYTVATGIIRHVAFSPDGELVALGGDSNSDIYIVSLFSGEVIGQYKINAMVVSLAWHPQRNWLAWATLSKANIPLWYTVKQD